MLYGRSDKITKRTEDLIFFIYIKVKQMNNFAHYLEEMRDLLTCQ